MPYENRQARYSLALLAGYYFPVICIFAGYSSPLSSEPSPCDLSSLSVFFPITLSRPFLPRSILKTPEMAHFTAIQFLKRLKWLILPIFIFLSGLKWFILPVFIFRWVSNRPFQPFSFFVGAVPHLSITELRKESYS